MIINYDGLSNYHTHSIYSDGDNTLIEMAEKAYSLGFHTLGYSEHQFSEPDSHYAMKEEEEENYISDIRWIEKVYEGKLRIFSGIERDYYCDRTDEKFDYVIGSVHHIKVGDEYFNVDESSKSFEEGVNKLFGGDYLSMAKAYFDLERDVVRKTGCHIIGHFDLLRKFNEGNAFFDEDSPEYLAIARDALHDIVESFDVNSLCKPPEGRSLPPQIERALDRGKPIFEINTGAMAKGKRTSPYPAPALIHELLEMEVPIVLSSDCHKKDFLNFGFGSVKKI